MIDFSMESKLYKVSKFIYELLKINLMVLMLSFSLVGFGSAISSGFYELNQVYRKKSESNFGRFLVHFRENFRISLFFTAPFIFVVYVFWRSYSGIILESKVYFYSFLVILVLVFSYMFAMLIINGLLNMNVKNSLIYGLILVSERIFVILPGLFLVILMIKAILMSFPVLLVFVNVIIPMVFFYFVYERIINNKEFLTDEGDKA